MNIRIENANAAHSTSIERLSEELGYRVSSSEVQENLSKIAQLPHHKVWVALRGNEVVGWCHAGMTYWVMMESMVEVFGLVVSSGIRNAGVGKMLIEEVERFARESGVNEVWIRSNRKRKESHPFYLHIGYENIKDQAVYAKKVIA